MATLVGFIFGIIVCSLDDRYDIEEEVAKLKIPKWKKDLQKYYLVDTGRGTDITMHNNGWTNSQWSFDSGLLFVATRRWRCSLRLDKARIDQGWGADIIDAEYGPARRKGCRSPQKSKSSLRLDNYFP